MYAADSHVYKTFNDLVTSTVISHLQTCPADINRWMKTNKLQLEPSQKCKVFSRNAQKVTWNNKDRHWKCPLDPSTCVRNLGVMFDAGLTKEQQVSGMCKASGLPIRNVGKAINYLTPRTAEEIVHS